MLTYTADEIALRGVKLHYYRTGGDKPPLVLAHGVTDDGLCWSPFASVMARHYDIIMLDARGHGKSDAPEDGYTLENLSDDIAGLIQGLGLDKPFVLGHSMGAISTLVMAARFPGLPRAILLEDPPPFWMMSARHFQDDDFVQGFFGWISSLKRRTYDELLAECRAQDPAWSEDERGPWVNSKHRFSLRILDLIRPPDVLSLDLPQLFQRITCPVLFLSADPEKRAASGPLDIAALKALVPQMAVVPFPGAGHNIRREQFARYLEAVQSFLAVS